MTNYKLLRI